MKKAVALGKNFNEVMMQWEAGMITDSEEEDPTATKTTLKHSKSRSMASSLRKDTTTGFKKQPTRKLLDSQLNSTRGTDGNVTQTIPTKKKKRAEIHRRSVFDAYLEMKRENFHNISLPDFELRDESR